MSNPLDSFFDGMDKVVGGLEKSRDFAEKPLDESDTEDAELVEYKARTKPQLMWGHADEAFHIFEGFGKTSVCGSNFEPADITNRKTEMSSIKVVACGVCLRILHSKYQNA